MSFITVPNPNLKYRIKKSISTSDIRCSALRSIIIDYGRENVFLNITEAQNDQDIIRIRIKYRISILQNKKEIFMTTCSCMYYDELTPEIGTEQNCIFTDPKFLTKIYA